MCPPSHSCTTVEQHSHSEVKPEPSCRAGEGTISREELTGRDVASVLSAGEVSGACDECAPPGVGGSESDTVRLTCETCSVVSRRGGNSDGQIGVSTGIPPDVMGSDAVRAESARQFSGGECLQIGWPSSVVRAQPSKASSPTSPSSHSSHSAYARSSSPTTPKSEVVVAPRCTAKPASLTTCNVCEGEILRGAYERRSAESMPLSLGVSALCKIPARAWSTRFTR